MSSKADQNNAEDFFCASLDNKGRLLLPSELRKRAGFKSGDVLAISLDHNLVLHASSLQKKIRSLRGILKSKQKKQSIVDELLAERKREALHE